MPRLGKHNTPTATPDAIHAATTEYDGLVQARTYSALGRLAREENRKDNSVLRAIADDGLPIVANKDQYRHARELARDATGPHPAISMTGEVPVVSGDIPPESDTKGKSAFDPDTTTPIGHGGVTVNPNAPQRDPAVRVNMQPPSNQT